MKVIKRDQLIEVLGDIHEETWVELVAVTDPRLLKKNKGTGNVNPHYGNVVKHQRYIGLVCFDYDAELHAARSEAGLDPVEAEPARLWGDHVGDSPLVIKDGRHYLEMRVTEVRDPDYYVRSTGEAIDRTLAEQFLPKKSSFVQVRTFDLRHIHHISIAGVEYHVTD